MFLIAFNMYSRAGYLFFFVFDVSRKLLLLNEIDLSSHLIEHYNACKKVLFREVI